MQTNLRSDSHAHQARRFNPDIWRHLRPSHSLSRCPAQTKGPGKDGVVASKVWNDDKGSKPDLDCIRLIGIVWSIILMG